MAREQPRSGCAINAAVEVLGDAWSLIVLRDIVFGGRRHFRELLTRSDEGIASNILANRVRKLVEEGLLSRDDATRGQRATYSLTEAGIRTVPVLVALGTRGMHHRPTPPALTVRARIMAESPDLVDDLIDELREIHLGIPRRAPERLQHAFEAAVEKAGARVQWQRRARTGSLERRRLNVRASRHIRDKTRRSNRAGLYGMDFDIGRYRSAADEHKTRGAGQRFVDIGLMRAGQPIGLTVALCTEEKTRIMHREQLSTAVQRTSPPRNGKNRQ